MSKKQTKTSSKRFYDDTTESVGYIYMVQPREFIKSGEKVYKIGKTIQQPNTVIHRIKEYPKRSCLYFVRICDKDDTDDIEKDIKKEFNTKFEQHFEGTEYFIGESRQMINIMNKIFDHYVPENEEYDNELNVTNRANEHKHTCNICNYGTNVHSNYKRHNESESHKQNVTIHSKINEQNKIVHTFKRFFNMISSNFIDCFENFGGDMFFSTILLICVL